MPSHKRIVEAILAGDARHAETEMRKHINRSIAMVERASERVFRQ